MDSLNEQLKKETEIKTFHSNEDDFSNYEEATFFSRFIAAIIDGFIITFITKVVNTLIGMGLQVSSILDIIALIVKLLLPISYQIFFLRRNGQTLGKMAMKIKVVNQENSDGLDYITILLREALGKFISMIVLGIGYIVVLFGKRSWHDNIANTKVIKIK